MSERPHRKLAKFHVLFLGDSTPEESKSGLKALQQPLMRCYPVDSPNEVEGIDSWVTVFSSGILLQYVGTKSDQPPPIWFPIQNLYVAAATKCINYIDRITGRRVDTEFVDINNPTAERSSHPPLFSIIVRKASGKRILRCYTFLVRDEAPAVAMVDAAKHAFTHESGWSQSHPPSEVIKNELVQPTADTDDIDQFDSVSTTGRRANQNGARNDIPSPNHSQDISDSDIPSASTHETDKSTRTFPQHLVKKYTLTNTRRPGNSPRRGGLPEEFMPRGSVRGASGYSGMRTGPPPSMVGGSMRAPPSMVGSMAGSMRSTSTIRVVNDPRTGAPVIERTIREQVPVPVPVYQQPPPPRIIHEVRPIYIPQPPEIRHVEVERQVPVPVEIPVPYAVGPDVPPYGDYPRRSHSKHSRKHKSNKHNTFKNYEVFDDRFSRPQGEHSFFDAQNFHVLPPNGYYNPPGEHFHARPPPSHQQQHHRKSKRSPEGRGRRERSPSGSRSSSSDREQKYKHAWEGLDQQRTRNGGGIEITEIPDDREHRRHSKKHRNKDTDINGNHHKSTSGDYHIRELEKDTSKLNMRGDNKQSRVEAEVHGADFKWSQIPSPEERRKSERRSGRRSPSPVRNGGDGISRVYEGGRLVGDGGADKTDGVRRISSFQAYGRFDGGDRQESRKEKKKEKKKRDKTPNRHDAAMKSGIVKPGGKEYYFKEQTEAPPRNWMDEQKEYMNERAFSSSLAHEPNSDLTNAYALNKTGDDMFDRSMPAPPQSQDIPAPPPLPAGLMAEINSRGNNADLY